MADHNVSPEGAALALLHLVANTEGKSFQKGLGTAANREWILSTYRECLEAVSGSGGDSVYEQIARDGMQTKVR